MDLRRFSAIDTWIFDLDNTLYPAQRVFAEVGVRARDFIVDRLQISEEEASALRDRFFREHGTTMRGLMLDYGLPPMDFLGYVEDLDVSHLAEDAALQRALAALPGRKIIFTNASNHHAENVLRQLNLRHHFDAVFDIEVAEFVPKPQRVTYEKLLSLHLVDPKRACMVEDMAINLMPAHALGMVTVWLRPSCGKGQETLPDLSHVDYTIDHLGHWLLSLMQEPSFHEARNSPTD